jgi:cytochrome c biogenesis protein CcdA
MMPDPSTETITIGNTMTRSIARILFTLALLIVPVGNAFAVDEKPDLLFFFSKDCEHCQRVQKEFLPGFLEKYGELFAFKSLEVSKPVVMDSLFAIESRLAVPEADKDFPVVYFLGRIFEGEVAVRLQLETWVKRYPVVPDSLMALHREVMARPAEIIAPTVTSAPDSVHVAYFYKHGCEECARTEEIIDWVKRTYPFVVVDTFDIAEEKSKHISYLLGVTAGVPDEKLMATPTVFAGDGFLLPEGISRRAVADLIEKHVETGAKPVWRGFGPEDFALAEEGIRALFDTFTALTVSLVGLVDGINPCAFATILFFVSYLGMIGRKRNEIAIVGLSFAATVFVTYFLVGLGAFALVRRMAYLDVFARIVFGLMGVGCIIFGVLSIGDYFKARSGNTAGMSLQLPAVLKRLIHTTIRKQVRMRSYVMGAIITGFTVSILELACTGQVYLPTITMLVGQESKAVLYLLLYNFWFIVPLLAVFGIVYFGVSSKRIATVMEANVGMVKLVLAIVFFLIGILLIRGAF